MYATVEGTASRPPQTVHTVAQSFRSNARGVQSAIFTARGKMLRAARQKRWQLNPSKIRNLISHIQEDFHSKQQEVEAEVGEFIQSPHLLFAPLRMLATLALPLCIPLLFMPTYVLIIYALFVIAWYLTCLLMFATEVAMRPPWYKKGLPTNHLPPYWSRYVHDPKVDLGRYFEAVQFISETRVTLRGWFIPAIDENTDQPSTKMIVFVHGVGRDRRNFLRHSQHFLQHGYSCLLFDFSEHGLSDGIVPGISRGTLFGAREQYDVAAAVNFLKTEKNATHVAIVGTSCGASSAILAAARYPDMAVCVVAENPFTRADHLLVHHLDLLSKNYLSQNSHQTVRRAIFWLAGKMLMIRMGYYLNSFGALDAASSLVCPLLIAHSTADDIVPYQHGIDIYNRALNSENRKLSTTKFVQFTDAAHCALYDKDPHLWVSTVLPFVTQAFEGTLSGRKQSDPTG